MLHKISLVFRLIKSTIGISKFNNPQSSYHREARELINSITAPFDLESVPHLPTNFKLKLQWYMAECLYGCENYARLLHHQPTTSERKSYLLSGALGAMSDVIIDDVEMKKDDINRFKSPKLADEYTDVIGKFYATCYHTFISSLEAEIKDRTISYYQLLFDAQVRSKQQFNADITREEVDQICKDKCGYSLLFLRSLVKGDITPQEKLTWYELGGFIQYCNDAQDLHKDLQKNLKTFASIRPTLEIIASDLDNQKIIAFSLLKDTPFETGKKDDFIFVIHMMSIAIFAKLNAFSLLCDSHFSHDSFLLKSKKEVCSAVTPIRLFTFWFPKVMDYNYNTVDLPYTFIKSNHSS